MHVEIGSGTYSRISTLLGRLSGMGLAELVEKGLFNTGTGSEVDGCCSVAVTAEDVDKGVSEETTSRNFGGGDGNLSEFSVTLVEVYETSREGLGVSSESVSEETFELVASGRTVHKLTAEMVNRLVLVVLVVAGILDIIE